MSISLRTRKSILTPSLSNIKDPAIAEVLNDLAKIIKESFNNVYDDLSSLSTTTKVDSVYFGSPTTDGTWRIIPSGNDLSIQRRESGVWVQKDLITA